MYVAGYSILSPPMIVSFVVQFAIWLVRRASRLVRQFSKQISSRSCEVGNAPLDARKSPGAQSILWSKVALRSFRIEVKFILALMGIGNVRWYIRAVWRQIRWGFDFPSNTTIESGEYLTEGRVVEERGQGLSDTLVRGLTCTRACPLPGLAQFVHGNSTYKIAEHVHGERHCGRGGGGGGVRPGTEDELEVYLKGPMRGPTAVHAV